MNFIFRANQKIILDSLTIIMSDIKSEIIF